MLVSVITPSKNNHKSPPVFVDCISTKDAILSLQKLSRNQRMKMAQGPTPVGSRAYFAAALNLAARHEPCMRLMKTWARLIWIRVAGDRLKPKGRQLGKGGSGQSSERNGQSQDSRHLAM